MADSSFTTKRPRGALLDGNGNLNRAWSGYLDAMEKALWPVNSVMVTAVNTNPNVLLGFGTWSSVATGAIFSGCATAFYAWKRTA